MLLQNDKSQFCNVLPGVPQGSVLGPQLFIPYINDLSNKIESSLRLYADDVILYSEIHSEQDIIRLQRDLDTITQWAETWLMKLHKVWTFNYHKSEEPHKFKLLY